MNERLCFRFLFELFSGNRMVFSIDKICWFVMKWSILSRMLNVMKTLCNVKMANSQNAIARKLCSNPLKTNFHMLRLPYLNVFLFFSSFFVFFFCFLLFYSFRGPSSSSLAKRVVEKKVWIENEKVIFCLLKITQQTSVWRKKSFFLLWNMIVNSEISLSRLFFSLLPFT